MAGRRSVHDVVNGVAARDDAGNDPLCARVITAESRQAADKAAVLARYGAWLRQGRLASSTARTYGAVAARWLAAGGEAGHVDAVVLQGFLARRRRTLGAAAMVLEVCALRHFYGVMYLLGVAGSDLGHHLPRMRRPPVRLVRTLSDEQLGRILAQPDLATSRGWRDHLVLRLLYETGLRSGELCRLGLDDVLPEGWLYVQPGKTRRARYVPLASSTEAVIGEWVARWRRGLCGRRRGELLVSSRGGALTPYAVWELVQRHVRSACALPGGFRLVRATHRRTPWSGLYPHLLRASFATALLERGAPLTAIGQLLGHERLESTARYAAVDLAGLRRAIALLPKRGGV